MAEFDGDIGKLQGGEQDVPSVQFKRLTHSATIPLRGTDVAAGYDLYCVENFIIPGHETKVVPLGFSTAMPGDIHARIESRSSLAIKGCVVLTGVIDADYRGEWKVILRNLNAEEMRFAKGDRVAQAVFRHTVAVTFDMRSELSESSREGGFGSTGR